jgi:hypothetical protein
MQLVRDSMRRLALPFWWCSKTEISVSLIRDSPHPNPATGPWKAFNFLFKPLPYVHLFPLYFRCEYVVVGRRSDANRSDRLPAISCSIEGAHRQVPSAKHFRFIGLQFVGALSQLVQKHSLAKRISQQHQQVLKSRKVSRSAFPAPSWKEPKTSPPRTLGEGKQPQRPKAPSPNDPKSRNRPSLKLLLRRV